MTGSNWQRRQGVRGVNEEDFAADMAAARLTMLRMEHRDLDGAIDALCSLASPDQLQLARLKKRKLRLRDEIVQLEGMAVPDIIA